MSRSHSVIVALAGFALFAASAFAQAPGREGGQPERAGQATAFADRMMAFDVNRDGKLALEEMDAQFAQTMMDRADANKDGFLTREELIAMAQQRITGGRPSQPAEADEGDEHGEEESFHESMEQAGRGLRGFRRSPMDETSREADLKAVHAIQFGLILAKSQVGTVEMSDASKETFGSDTAAHHAAMHLTLIKVIMKTLEFEQALLEGDPEKSKKIFAAIRELRAEAHDQFEPEEEDHEEESPAPRRPERGGRGGGEG